MLDLKMIRQNPEAVKSGIKKKGRDPKLIDNILVLDKEYRELLVNVEELKSLKNKASDEIAKSPKDQRQKLIDTMQDVTKKEKNLEEKMKKVKEELDAMMIELPNPPLESVPEGKNENENKVIKTVGEKPSFDFKPLDHMALGERLNLIDIENASKTSGTRFYYLKNEAVLLEFALVQFVIGKLIKKGFSPIIPPVLVQEKAMFGTGFFPADRNEIYHVNPRSETNPDGDDLFLVGTAEVPLCMLHYDSILANEKLPLRYAGFSTCFRREAGSYGKDTKGILRVHQFDKIEMFSFCDPKKSEKEHELILSLEEEIMKELGFHYQVVLICGGDLGAPAAKKYDIEVWLPGQQRYRELTSCSNCTDFQARRSNIRYKTAKGNEILHTLNGTACAIGRTLIAILENYQNKDGTVTVPEVLRSYVGKEKIN
ncbi:serine--tRNA ligase [Candidatus Peregrinibacteria bacterium]|nr:serine--tRNA ligase [Candidatus Peregrinibacteria bacterium]